MKDHLGLRYATLSIFLLLMCGCSNSARVADAPQAPLPKDKTPLSKEVAPPSKEPVQQQEAEKLKQQQAMEAQRQEAIVKEQAKQAKLEEERKARLVRLAQLAIDKDRAFDAVLSAVGLSAEEYPMTDKESVNDVVEACVKKHKGLIDAYRQVTLAGLQTEQARSESKQQALTDDAVSTLIQLAKDIAKQHVMDARGKTK